VTSSSKGSAAAVALPFPLSMLERRLELVDRLRARGVDDVAGELLGRVIDELGVELAKYDLATRELLAFEAMLEARARAPIAFEELVPIKRERPSGEGLSTLRGNEATR
jgi:hypothetical protein